MVELIDRGVSGNKWNIPKFIDLWLLPNYIYNLGPASIFNVSFAERGLKDWAKKPSRTSQKRNGGIFERQCATRVYDNEMTKVALVAIKNETITKYTPGQPSSDMEKEEESMGKQFLATNCKLKFETLVDVVMLWLKMLKVGMYQKK